MTLKEIQHKANEANEITKMVKDALIKLLTDRMRALEADQNKLDTLHMDDEESITGVDFRKLSGGRDFTPDNAVDDDQVIVGIFWDPESGCPMFLKEGDDETEVSILDERFTADDLLTAAKLVEDWMA